MPRKKWTPEENITPELLKFREKRKWQIALRRYVLHKSPCIDYAPYFGIGNDQMKKWFEYQFTTSQSWESFGTNWQFDHIIPVTYFDFDNDSDLKLCWNFTNLRVESIRNNKDRGQWLDLLTAKDYYIDLFNSTKYPICGEMIKKIDQIKLRELLTTEPQKAFLVKYKDYLAHIQDYSSFEFELLNSGRTFAAIQQEVDFFKKLNH